MDYGLLLLYYSIISIFISDSYTFNKHVYYCLSLVTYSSDIHRSRFLIRYIDTIHFIHTVCLDWLNSIRAIIVINQFFINVSCTNTKLHLNSLYRILIWFICIVCYYIITIIYFHHIQCHCIHISLILSGCFILGNSHLQFSGV